jgi:hypothetical protein
VQALYLPAASEIWGTFEAPTGSLELHAGRRPGDEELLELAAVMTLRGGGAVYLAPDVEALNGAPLAGLLRR